MLDRWAFDHDYPDGVNALQNPLSSRGNVLGKQRLILFVAIAASLLIVYYAALWPWLPESFRKPGSPVLQSFAIVGSLLLLISAGFVLAKRLGRWGSPIGWFRAHVVGGLAGGVLVFVHAAGGFDRPPALLLLVLVALVVLGVWARLRGARNMAQTFGSKVHGFYPGIIPVPGTDGAEDRRADIAAVLERKRAVLARLDPNAMEATFSVTLPHWFRHPLLAWRYWRLAEAESRLIGQRASVGRAQAWWRAVHLLLAAGFVFGLITHIIVVTFFAGYAAEGREIYWWYVTDW